MLRPVAIRIPALTGARVLLRAFREEDAPAVLRMRSNPQVMRFIPKPLGTAMTDALHLIDGFKQDALKGNAAMWAVTIRGNEDLVGYVGFWRIDRENHRGELGYALDPDLWGQGLMAEAVRLVLEHGFAKIKLHSVEAAVHPGNKASIRVLERNGFVQEAHFRQNIHVNGGFLDTLVFSMLSPSA